MERIGPIAPVRATGPSSIAIFSVSKCAITSSSGMELMEAEIPATTGGAGGFGQEFRPRLMEIDFMLAKGKRLSPSGKSHDFHTAGPAIEIARLRQYPEQ